MELTKKYRIVHRETEVVYVSLDGTGTTYPGAGTTYFETDDRAEFDQYITDNNLVYEEPQYNQQ